MPTRRSGFRGGHRAGDGVIVPIDHWRRGRGSIRCAPEYRKRDMAQLAELDPARVIVQLTALAVGRVPALLWFEKPPPDPAWCHRGLVSAWFKDKLGIDVPEFGHEILGGGWAHPKLPAEWRRVSRTS